MAAATYFLRGAEATIFLKVREPLFCWWFLPRPLKKTRRQAGQDPEMSSFWVKGREQAFCCIWQLSMGCCRAAAGLLQGCCGAAGSLQRTVCGAEDSQHHTQHTPSIAHTATQALLECPGFSVLYVVLGVFSATHWALKTPAAPQQPCRQPIERRSTCCPPACSERSSFFKEPRLAAGLTFTVYFAAWGQRSTFF